MHGNMTEVVTDCHRWLSKSMHRLGTISPLQKGTRVIGTVLAKLVCMTTKLQDSQPLRKFEFGHLVLSTAAGGDHLQMCKLALYYLRAVLKCLHAGKENNGIATERSSLTEPANWA